MSTFAGAAAAHASRHQASSHSYSGDATYPEPPPGETSDSLTGDSASVNSARPSITTALRRRHHHVSQQNLISTNPAPATSSPSPNGSASTVVRAVNDDTTPIGNAALSDENATANPNVLSRNGIPARATGVQRPPPPEAPATTASNLREKAMTGAMGLGLVTAAVGATYFLSENEAFLPFAIAACVATISSLLLRYILSSIHIVTHRPRVRHLRHHRHFTGERAEYVRASQRLAMMDRDFTDADYELLLDLDNHSQRLRRFLDGASEETVARLPTCVYKSPSAHQCAEKIPEVSSELGNDVGPKVGVEDGEGVQIDSLAGATARKCLICLEDFQDGMMIRTLPCFHRFMADCIDTWLTQQAKCPICKRSIQEDMNSLPPGIKISDNIVPQ